MIAPDVLMMLTAAILTAALIGLSLPLLKRIALAKPNARSSHKVPTPQGGGLAVVVAAAMSFIGVDVLSAGNPGLLDYVTLGVATAILMIVGALDDIFAVAVMPRLVLQAVAIFIAVVGLPDSARAAAFLPLGVERGAEVMAGLWFVNLTNFMDGIDWMSVCETVPITASIYLLSLQDIVVQSDGLIALALCGAMLGFAPFNKPVARLFLGDVGSLPIGLLQFWMLLRLAAGGHLAAALLLPLYYVADATLTLLWRLRRGENIATAHRSHFYQVAVQRGLPVPSVSRLVFGANLVLALLAELTTRFQSPITDVAALVCGAAIIGLLLMTLRRGRTS